MQLFQLLYYLLLWWGVLICTTMICSKISGKRSKVEFGSIIDNVVTAIIGGGAGWFFGKRNNNAQASVTEGDATARMQANYKTYIEDNNAQMDVLKKDISFMREEVKRCEEERSLYRQEQFIKDYASSEFGLAIIDFDGIVTYVNIQFAKYLKLKMSELVGKDYTEYLTKEDAEEAAKVWESGKESIEIINYTNRWTVNGKKVEMNWVKLLNDLDGRKAYCVLRVK